MIEIDRRQLSRLPPAAPFQADGPVLPSSGLRARAPLRLGLAGGGTDLSAYCDAYGGAVLNATIDLFAFAHIAASHDGRLTFRARDLGAEEAFDPRRISLGDGQLRLHRGVYRRFVKEGWLDPDLCFTLSTTSDAPAGSGLGSSSALVVAMVEALRSALALPMTRYEVARIAYEIERVDLALAGGRQDQYAAAFGGVNFLEFLPTDQVVVNPLRLGRPELNEVEASLVICFSGRSRQSDVIIKDQIRGLDEIGGPALSAMHRLKEEALAMKFALLEGDVCEVARILNDSFRAKKATAAGISTPEIDRLFAIASLNGALGGKVSGAGGGGFLMFCTDPENRYRLVSALNAAGGSARAVKFTFEGTEAWSVPA